MTISQLAQIAVEEDRVVNISCPVFTEHGYHVRLAPDDTPVLVQGHQVLAGGELKTRSLAKDDWFEVK